MNFSSLYEIASMFIFSLKIPTLFEMIFLSLNFVISVFSDFDKIRFVLSKLVIISFLLLSSQETLLSFKYFKKLYSNPSIPKSNERTSGNVPVSVIFIK